MEIKIRLNISGGIVQAGVHCDDRLAHGCQQLLLNARGRQSGNLRLEHLS